jgi:hypothetical protein
MPGTPLAQLEGQIAIGTVLQRFPEASLACCVGVVGCSCADCRGCHLSCRARDLDGQAASTDNADSTGCTDVNNSTLAGSGVLSVRSERAARLAELSYLGCQSW